MNGFVQQPGDMHQPPGILSSLGVDNDYHACVKDLLHKLADELRHCHGDFKYKILVDSPSLDERALAQRGGLGFYGRNGLIISHKFGSRFNIGCLLTDIPLDMFQVGLSCCNDIESPDFQGCPPDCSLCVDACPGGALGGGNLDVSRCISYLTQKQELTPEESALVKGHLYGCDVCQDVCPFNSHREPIYINPQVWADMDDDAFDREYGHTAMLWRGAELLRRNARIACAK